MAAAVTNVSSQKQLAATRTTAGAQKTTLKEKDVQQHLYTSLHCLFTGLKKGNCFPACNLQNFTNGQEQATKTDI